jgi:hypothetical protein
MAALSILFQKALRFTLTAYVGFSLVPCLQEVLFGFQSAMVPCCRLLPGRNDTKFRYFIGFVGDVVSTME